jgi:hypothetical protein
MDGPPRCIVCLKVQDRKAPIPHKRCPKCAETTYCSLACRKKHWPSHRTRCGLARLEQTWNGGDAHLQPLPPKGSYHPPQSYVPPRGWGQATMEERQKNGGTSASASKDILGAPLKSRKEMGAAGTGAAKRAGGAMGGWQPPGGGWGQATLVKAAPRKSSSKPNGSVAGYAPRGGWAGATPA